MPALTNTAHEKFCHEYLKDFNAARAYRDSGYSEKGAGQSAHILLNNPEIKARLSELVGEVLADDKQQIRQIILKLQEQAFGSLADLAEWYSTPIYPEKLDDVTGDMIEDKNAKPLGYSMTLKIYDSKDLGPKAALIEGISMTKFGPKLKMKSSDKALELLGRYYKMWTDKLDLSSSDGTMSPRGMADYYAAISKSEP